MILVCRMMGSRIKLVVAWRMVLVLLVQTSLGANLCEWGVQQQNKLYSFNLAAPLSRYPHGILSEDGFYKVSQNNSDTGTETKFWFQLCEQMIFNHDPPVCFRCQACGGPLHCGLTCSALMEKYDAGYYLCTTLGYASSSNVSLIDGKSPEKGVMLNMSASTAEGDCSFSVSVYCNVNGVEAPTSVSRSGNCNYITAMKHPAGCPVVTSIKNRGLGWLSTLIIILFSIFAAYLLVGVIYRFFFSWDPWQRGYSKFRILAQHTGKDSGWTGVHIKQDRRHLSPDQTRILYSSLMIQCWSNIFGVPLPCSFSEVLVL